MPMQQSFWPSTLSLQKSSVCLVIKMFFYVLLGKFVQFWFQTEKLSLLSATITVTCHRMKKTLLCQESRNFLTIRALFFGGRGTTRKSKLQNARGHLYGKELQKIMKITLLFKARLRYGEMKMRSLMKICFDNRLPMQNCRIASFSGKINWWLSNYC